MAPTCRAGNEKPESAPLDIGQQESTEGHFLCEWDDDDRPHDSEDKPGDSSKKRRREQGSGELVCFFSGCGDDNNPHQENDDADARGDGFHTEQPESKRIAKEKQYYPDHHNPYRVEPVERGGEQEGTQGDREQHQLRHQQNIFVGKL